MTPAQRELPEWPTKERFTSKRGKYFMVLHEQAKAEYWYSRLREAVEALQELSMQHLNAHDMTFKASSALSRIGVLPPTEDK